MCGTKSAHLKIKHAPFWSFKKVSHFCNLCRKKKEPSLYSSFRLIPKIFIPIPCKSYIFPFPEQISWWVCVMVSNPTFKCLLNLVTILCQRNGKWFQALLWFAEFLVRPQEHHQVCGLQHQPGQQRSIRGADAHAVLQRCVLQDLAYVTYALISSLEFGTQRVNSFIWMMIVSSLFSSWDSWGWVVNI